MANPRPDLDSLIHLNREFIRDIERGTAEEPKGCRAVAQMSKTVTFAVQQTPRQLHLQETLQDAVEIARRTNNNTLLKCHPLYQEWRPLKLLFEFREREVGDHEQQRQP